MMRMERDVTYMPKKKNVRRILLRKRHAKRPLGRLRRTWENIQMDLQRIGWSGLGRIHLVQNRDKCRALVNTLMDVLVP
jgi:hypothetical protein